MKSSTSATLGIFVALAIFLLMQTGLSVGSTQCKELNQINCYSAQNEGYFCNSKDESKAQPRWFYDKGVCKKFNYKGCYGNRNRFCTKESCERRCL